MEFDYSCFSFVIKEMGWANLEPHNLAINDIFKINGHIYNLHKFLICFAKHIGRDSLVNLEFGQKSNLITFIDDSRCNAGIYKSFEHIAVIDKTNPLKVYQRRQISSPQVENVFIENCGYLRKGVIIDYWKIPETKNLRGFLG